MGRLMERVIQKAQELCVPLSVHLDVTWRCNASCLHCYLSKPGGTEMSTAEIKHLLEEMAEAGTLFLLISGGEPFLREDLLEVAEIARRLRFSVKLKTNGALLGAAEAKRIARLALAEVGVSLYSHRPEIHDAIVGLSGGWQRALEAVRSLRSEGVRVRITCVLMRENAQEGGEVQKLARELGAEFSLDATITPRLDEDPSVLAHNVPMGTLRAVVHDDALVGNAGEYCALRKPGDARGLDTVPCSAAHTSCYITPWGELWPCVQFPLRCGNVRAGGFRQTWQSSMALRMLRTVRERDLPWCSECALFAVCSRCPGLAFLEGDVLGPSSLDCRKSYARTGMRDPRMKLKLPFKRHSRLPAGREEIS